MIDPRHRMFLEATGRDPDLADPPGVVRCPICGTDETPCPIHTRQHRAAIKHDGCCETYRSGVDTKCQNCPRRKAGE